MLQKALEAQSKEVLGRVDEAKGNERAYEWPSRARDGTWAASQSRSHHITPGES